jgi:hypothetical protein
MALYHWIENIMKQIKYAHVTAAFWGEPGMYYAAMTITKLFTIKILHKSMSGYGIGSYSLQAEIIYKTRNFFKPLLGCFGRDPG